MNIVVNNGVPDDGEPQAAPEVVEQVVADNSAPEAQVEVTSEADDNLFNNVTEPNPNDSVPLKVMLEAKAKEKHKRVQAQQEADKLRQERDQLAQQLQYQQQQVQGQQQVFPNQQAYTPEMIMDHIDKEAHKKAINQQIVDLVTPAMKKYDDFIEVTEDLPWGAGLILAAKRELPDAADFIYHLSKNAPDKVREMANASTAEERGLMLAELKNKWKSRTAAKSPDKKVISKTDSPPSQQAASSPGLAKIANESYKAALLRTGRFRA